MGESESEDELEASESGDESDSDDRLNERLDRIVNFLATYLP
jgi:hypothetical protein